MLVVASYAVVTFIVRMDFLMDIPTMKGSSVVMNTSMQQKNAMMIEDVTAY